MTDIGKLTSEIYGKLQKLKKEDATNVIRAVGVLLGTPDNIKQDTNQENSDESDSRFNSFFERDEDLKPADNALLCAAYHFSLYGNAKFSNDEIKEIGNDAGVILPDRPDSTLNMVKKKGKKLFNKSGRGIFKPTAAAATYFKEQWNVKPGKKKKNEKTAKE